MHAIWPNDVNFFICTGLTAGIKLIMFNWIQDYTNIYVGVQDPDPYLFRASSSWDQKFMKLILS